MLKFNEAFLQDANGGRLLAVVKGFCLAEAHDSLLTAGPLLVNDNVLGRDELSPQNGDRRVECRFGSIFFFAFFVNV